MGELFSAETALDIRIGKEFYHGCTVCSDFSGKLVRDPSYGERFERTKEEFVKHFNEKHQDIMRNRTRSSIKRKFKKIPAEHEALLTAIFMREYNNTFT